MKVFGVGFHKTGTKTLASALDYLGYKVCSSRPDLLSYIKSNEIGKVYEIVDQYDAFQDNPWPLLYQELDQKYPGSKFILTTRDEEKWIRSVANHFGNHETIMREWIYGAGAPKGNEAKYKHIYREHNKSVMHYFQGREKSFVNLSWESGDGWEELCSFLRMTPPDKPFPWINKREYPNFTSGIKRKLGAFKRKINS